jgi:glycosyltransferase involved in cell wall biosynthesis
MKVWILQTGEPLHIDKDDFRPMRAINLSNKLVDCGHQVTLWSSDFDHQKKVHRSNTYKKIIVNNNLKIILIPSTGYKKNIGLSRLIDHFFLAFNLHKKLNLMTDLPDVAFVGYPPIESAFIMTRWLKKKGIPTMLDVKDQWPLVLVKTFPKFLRLFARILCSPYYILAKKSMRNASCISSMSYDFLVWARNFSNSRISEFDKVVNFTWPVKLLTDSELSSARLWWSQNGILENDKFRIIFVGSFSRAFDFNVIFEAAKELSNQNVNCEFVLCGNGEFYKDLDERAQNSSNVKIIGWIDQSKIIALGEMSSVYIAPYKNRSDFIMSIPNKIVDSLRLALPLICPLKGEVNALININNIGFYYNDASSLSNSIMTLVNDSNLQKKMSNNAKNLHNNKFEFHNVYGGLVNHLENMLNSDLS